MTGYSPIGDINSGDQSFGARRPFLVDGDFVLEIDRCVERGRGTDKHFVIEATVLEGNAPERPPGTQVAIFIDMSNNDTRGKHLCAFIASCHNVDPMQLPKNSTGTPWDGQPWAGYVVWAMSEQNPYARHRIFCNAQSVWTKNNTPWTLHTFSPYGSKAIGPRIFGPAYNAAPAQAGAAPAPAAAPGNGFQAPMQQPGAAPQGFSPAPMPPQGMPGGGGAPLGGFVPPGGVQQPQQGAPPAGWAPAPAPGYSPAPAFQPQQQPAQPAYAPAPAPAYAPAQTFQPQQPQQQPAPAYAPAPVFQPQQPVQQPGFGGPWGGGGQR